MYIEPFWCGVGATIIAEIVAIIVGMIISNHRKKR